MNHALYLVYRLLMSPLEAFFTLLIFILTKEMDATVLQLTILACSKPTVSLVAYKASTFLTGKPHRIKPFLIATTLISSVPCLFFPFIENNWFYIASYALFMISLRSSYPILVECLEQDKTMTKVVAGGSALNYGMIIFIPLLMAHFMDQQVGVWKILFFTLAFLQLGNLVVLYFLRVRARRSHNQNPTCLKILKENPGFAKYQLLFFLGGFGLVAIQPILPIYFTEQLSLTYTQLAAGFSVCRGLSFVFSSPFWVRILNRRTFFLVSAAFNTFALLFIVFLLMAGMGIYWLYVAYLMYGALQSGCELSWNVSGPYFAKDTNSIPYAGVSHLFVGLRGMTVPFLGQLLFMYSGSVGVFLISGAFSFITVLYALRLHQTEQSLWTAS